MPGLGEECPTMANSPSTQASITAISSMATRQVLEELAADHAARTGVLVHITFVGGVDAAKRVAQGEAFDVVFLAAGAVDKLIASGQVVAGSRVDLARSPIAAAVRSGAPVVDVSSDAAVLQAVRAARNIGYSTGPSGVHLAQVFSQWGLEEHLRTRTVQAPPGVPVGELVARGEVELGFQQLGELLHVGGIQVLGLLGGAAQYITTFSAGVCATCTQPQAVAGLLAFLNSEHALAAKRRQGMEPA
jgi:molybdate transport system substrate-binding protein